MNTTSYELCKAAPVIAWPFIKIAYGGGDSVRNRKDSEHKHMLIRSKLCVFVFRCVRISNLNVKINYSSKSFEQRSGSA